jgi:hypothetical protein
VAVKWHDFVAAAKALPEDPEYPEEYPEALKTDPEVSARLDAEAPTNEEQDQLGDITKGRGYAMGKEEVLQRVDEDNFTSPDPDIAQGFQVPTDESLDAALDASFNTLRPGLKDSKLLGSLEWEEPEDISATGGTGAPIDTAGVKWHNVEGDEPEDDDYGWGIKNAFMRGLIRAGSLIDIAQGDVEEFAEGMKEMGKYGVSEEDEAKLEKIREGDGFWTTLGGYIAEPRLALQIVVESLPMSTAPLVGGAAGAAIGTAAGGPVGTIAGGAVGAGLGSFGTEYLASISEAVSEHGVDTTDANQLRAAFADDKFMATAREHAAKRGIGVAAFDALSMGIAGRIYKPIKALTGAAKKTGGAIGGTSELLAQGFAGAGGEGAGALLAGDELSGAAMAEEFVGELVPGLGEIAINKARGRDAGGSKPEPTTPAAPQGDMFPDKDLGQGTLDDQLGDPADVTAAGDVPADVLDSIPETDVDAEGKPYIVPEAIEATTNVDQSDMFNEPVTAEPTETSAPEPETATKPKPSEAPVAPDAEPITQEELEETAETSKEETPLISAKDLKPKINEQFKGTAEEQKPVRQAWKGLVDAIKQRYPDAELPTVGGRFSGTGLAKFFQTLQENVDITKDLPDLKTYLEEVTTGTPAETIKSLERVTSGVVAGIESTTVGAGGPILTQLRAVVNKFSESVKARGKKKGGGKARHLIQHANEVGELATGVEAAVLEGEKLGALEGLPADFNRTIAAAKTVAQNAQAPREVRTTAGGKQLKVDRTSRKHLTMLGKKLAIIAEQVSEAIASAETSVSFDALDASIAELDALIGGTTVKTKAAVSTSKAKKPKVKAKAPSKKAVTEPVSEPKTEEAPHKQQSTADWVRSHVRPAGKMGVTAGTVAAIEKNLQVLEESGHPEAALLRKQVEKTTYSELKPAGKLEAGAEVVYKPSKWKLVYTPTSKGKVAQLDTTPFVSGHDTKAAALKHARALREEMPGGKTDIARDSDYVTPEKKVPKKTAKAATKSKAKTKAKKEGKVKGANPDEVFDPTGRPLSGRRANAIVEDAEAEGSLAEVLNDAGVSKAAADKLEAIRRAVSPEDRKKIFSAVNDFVTHKDTLRLAAEIAEAVGKVPSQSVVDSIMEFASAIDQTTRDIEGSAREDQIAQYAEENSVSREDAESILEDTGAIESEDPYASYEELSFDALLDYDDSLDHQNTSRSDRLLISRAMDKIRVLLDSMKQHPGGNPDAPNISMQDILEELSNVLPANHRYAILVKRLMQLKLQVPIELFEDRHDVNSDGRTRGNYTTGWFGGVLDRAREKIKVHYDSDNVSDARFLQVLLHEMVHAATVHAYNTDNNFSQHINELWRQAVIAAKDKLPLHTLTLGQQKNIAAVTEYGTQSMLNLIDKAGEIKGLYGLANPLEMISEAYTNPRFQKFLATIPVETPSYSGKSPIKTTLAKVGKVKSLLGSFLKAVKQFIGYSTRNSVLNEIFFISDKYMMTEQQQTAMAEQVASGGLRYQPGSFAELSAKAAAKKKEPTPHSSKVQNILDGALSSRSGIGKMADSIKEAVTKLPRAVNLGFMNRDVIERKYRALFTRAAKLAGQPFNAMTQYVKAKQSASVLARKYEKKAYAVLQRAAKLDGKTRQKMYALMRDTTISMVWPDKALNHAANKHLWSKPNKKTGATRLLPKTAALATQARKDFIALQKESPDAAKIMMDMAALTKEIQAAKQAGALGALGKSYDLSSGQINALRKLTDTKNVDAMFPVANDSVLQDLQPVKGDSKERAKAKAESLAKIKENGALNSAAKTIIHGTSIKGPYFPLRRYGDYVVSTADADDGEPIVTFHATRAEAQRVSDAFNAEGRQTYVSRKLQSQAVSADLESVATEITKRLKGPDSGVMKSRLQTALIESLAENAAYASQLRRNNVDGIAGQDMGRALEEYVHVSKYTIGDLTTSHEVQAALTNLKKLQSAEELNTDDRIELGAVVNEIANQNREDANDREMSSVQTAIGAIGFFNFLGAPSYWALNATQTYTVTLPYLTAKWGLKGPAALLSAQKTVLAAATSALASKDKSYEGFKAQLPPAAQRIVERLEDSNILQSTIAHEFGDILHPSGVTNMLNNLPVVGRAANFALKAMEKVPESVEHFNRISTALAIYNLSGDIVAVEDGVQATQFNYDSANRARLLKALPMPAGGGARAVVTPVMMFKTYGIGIARLLYGSMADVIYKKGGRAEAAKMAGGLIVSHTVFGGVAGGLMLAPIAAIIGAFNMAFREAGDEFDPEEAVEEFLRDAGYDAMAVMARRGVSAAVLGIDMSKSINLGNLLWMGNDRINLGEAGGVETGLTTALGPVAQYGVTSIREGYRLFSGDNKGNWADFLAAIIPLKLARGVIKGSVYAEEGLHTDSDLQFLDADQLSSWGRMAMGFRPTEVSSAMDDYYEEQAREARRLERKSQLVEQLLRAPTSADYNRIWRDVLDYNASLEKRRDRINRGDVARLRSRRRSNQRDYDRAQRR